MDKQHSVISDIDLSKIKNRNERRVVECMHEVLEREYGDFSFDDLDVQDIYALALNLLPAQYAQQGSIVLSKRIPDFEIRSCLRQAVERVLDNPTRPK